jgi:hypothetical protein
MKDVIQKCRTEIKKLAEEGRKARVERQKLAGEERMYARQWYVDRVRPEARNFLLAYTLLRGRPRFYQERKALEEPNFYEIAMALQTCGLVGLQYVDAQGNAHQLDDAVRLKNGLWKLATDWYHTDSRLIREGETVRLALWTPLEAVA